MAIPVIADVTALNLTPGFENGLIAKLNSALSALEDGNPNNDHVTISKLEDFIDQVDGLSGNQILEADADVLIAAAELIIDLLSGP